MGVYPLTMFLVGSHTYGKIKIGAKSKVTTGNTFSNPTNGCGPNETAIGSGHKYEQIIVGEESKVHCGDTGGGGSKGHDFVEIEVGESSTIHSGDIESLDIKERVFA
jgi:hypothetical protein